MAKRTPTYRKHSTRDLGFGQWKGVRYYFEGPYRSESSWRGYHKFLRDVVGLKDDVPTDGSGCVALCVLAYLSHARCYYPTGNEYDNFRAALSPLVDLYGGLPIRELSPKKLRKYLEHLASTPGTRNGKPWPRSRSYCNESLRRVRQFIKWLVSEEYAPAKLLYESQSVQPLKQGHTVAPETEPRKPVDWPTVEATLKHLSDQVSSMVRVQWLTGCRPGQVCEMLNEEISPCGDLMIWRPHKHKTRHQGKLLTIFIGPKCQRVLKPYRRKTGYVFAPRGHRGGDHFQASSYRQAIQRAAKRASVDIWTPYQIRHSRGTEVEDFYDVMSAQASLGHARLDTTKIYTSQAHERAKKVAREMG